MIKIKNLPKSAGKYIAEFKCPQCESIVIRQRSNGERQKSCGCQSWARVSGKLHGMSKTRFYRIWQDMNLRCSQPNNTAYKWYGAKGIKVCVAWNRDNSYGFENFMKDMYDTYFDTGTIDRKDNKGNYEKGNCQWLTRGKNASKAVKGIKRPNEFGQKVSAAKIKYDKSKMLEVLSFLNEGGTTEGAVKFFNISRSTILLGFKRYGLIKPKSNFTYTPSRELLSRVEKITGLIRDGMSITKACGKIGLARQTYKKHKDKV